MFSQSMPSILKSTEEIHNPKFLNPPLECYDNLMISKESLAKKNDRLPIRLNRALQIEIGHFLSIINPGIHIFLGQAQVYIVSHSRLSKRSTLS